MMKTKYYIYSKHLGVPFTRESLKSAQEAAEDYAKKYPGESFEILQYLGHSSTSKASTFWADGCEPKPEPQPDADGWIEYDGTNRPPEDAMCYIRQTGSPQPEKALAAKHWSWGPVTHFKLA